MSKIIGLTGPTGSGKSSVSAVAEGLGIKVIDCDKYARIAVLKGSDGLKALTEVFGKEILFENGELNRKALAGLAFKTKENTELLNKTLLPFIVEIVNKQIGKEDVLLDAPTLFESGMNSICDSVIAVLSDREKRMKRITERDNLTDNEANLRIEAGKPDSFYKERADFIIYNNGSLENYLNEIEKIFNLIYGGKENG